MADHLWQYRTIRDATGGNQVRGCLACGMAQERDEQGEWPTPDPAECRYRGPTDITTQTVSQAILPVPGQQ
jgi:hypothetical protein